MSVRAPPPSGIERYGFLHDPEGRRRRGRRIVAAFADFGGLDVGAARVLDIGCSAGLVTHEIARAAALVVGVDIDTPALRVAAGSEGAARFAAAAGDRLPFAAAAFDAVVCNHVYEHVPEAAALVREILRVLRPGGVCYFAAGHTLQLVEPHYRLPLLSVLPRRVAGAWLRAAGRAQNYDERFLPPWRLRSLFVGFSAVELISGRMLREPARYGFGGLARLPSPLRLALRGAAPLVARVAPTWIFLLRR